jgi:hypothetical protein
MLGEPPQGRVQVARQADVHGHGFLLLHLGNGTILVQWYHGCAILVPWPVRHGAARHGTAWLVAVRSGKAVAAWLGWAGTAGRGGAGPGVAW